MKENLFSSMGFYLLWLLAAVLLIIWLSYKRYETTENQPAATQPASPYLIVVSVDSLRAADCATIKQLPNFKRLLDEGAYAQEVVGIYPSLTYPAHTSILTGTNPAKHGIYSNERFQPGVKEPGWFWHAREIKQPTLADLAKQNKLRVGAILWPVLAGASIDYNCPEIWPVQAGQNQFWLSLTNGSPWFNLRMFFKYGYLLDGKNQPNLDNFATASAAWLIREKQPNLLLLHLTDTDTHRHKFGTESAEALESLRRQDNRIGQLIEAAREAGIYERTTFVVLGDHGFLDVKYKINLNVALRQAGLITVDATGGVSDWKAYANRADGSAQITLKDPADQATEKAVAVILAQLKNDPQSGIEQVYDREAAAQKGVAGDFTFMVEAREGYYFVNNWWGSDLIETIPRKTDDQDLETGYAAVHGYDPLKTGYNSFFLASGAGVKPGVILPEINLIDTGPTMARFLELSFPEAEGRVLNEIMLQ